VSLEPRGYDPFVSDILDLQFRLAETVRGWAGSPGLDYVHGQPVAMNYFVVTFGAPEHEDVAALERLVRRGLLRVTTWYRDRHIAFDPLRHDFRAFIGRDFRMLLTSKGMEWFDAERRERAASTGIDTGDSAANAAVGRTLAALLDGRSISPERRKILELVLAKLTWIGAQNYRDAEFLSRKASRELDRARRQEGQVELERTFYQPFLYERLMQVPELGSHVTKDPEQAGGSPDFLVMGDVPIEAKVLYPEADPAAAGTIGLAQTAQYASRSGMGVICVLDMLPRNRAGDLSQLANDIRVEEVAQKGGPMAVRIVRIQHIVGLGPPSRVRPE